MARFMDIHTGMKGITQEKLQEEHRKDLALEKTEGVHFIQAWADPTSGRVFCLSEGPNRDAIRRVHQHAGHPADEIYEVPVEVK
ncbi:MAG TPA: SCO4226 family nickel-binding protein [Polyangia bacterium]|jgi:hypothetical protein